MTVASPTVCAALVGVVAAALACAFVAQTARVAPRVMFARCSDIDASITSIFIAAFVSAAMFATASDFVFYKIFLS
jgi:hypothetical protein